MFKHNDELFTVAGYNYVALNIQNSWYKTEIRIGIHMYVHTPLRDVIETVTAKSRSSIGKSKLVKHFVAAT